MLSSAECTDGLPRAFPILFAFPHLHLFTSSLLHSPSPPCHPHDLTWNPTGIPKALAPSISPMASDVGAAIEWPAIPAILVGSDATEPFPARDVYEVTFIVNSPASVANEGALPAPS